MKVIDASVVIKALIEDEPGYTKASTLVKKDSLVPEWLFIEVANVLATKTKYTESEAKELLDLVYDMEFKVEKVSRRVIEKAMVLSKRHKVAAYDMIYAVVAKKLRLKLVTADANFAQKTGFSFVEVL